MTIYSLRVTSRKSDAPTTKNSRSAQHGAGAPWGKYIFRGLTIALVAVAGAVATSTTLSDQNHEDPAHHSGNPPIYFPPRVAPVVTPPLPGEGVWTGQDKWRRGPAAIMTTTFRTDVHNPSVVAYVAWIRTSTTRLGLYLGYKGPGATPLDRGPEEIPLSGRPWLLGAFNSGFYEYDSKAGFFTHATTYFPMVKGLASVVEYANGTVDITNWTGGPTPPPNVLMARQNLHLLVDNSRVTPLVSSPDLQTVWGSTLHGVPTVWRTGIGIDRFGNLIYVAAPSQIPATLARIFVQLGCVRAMQLDINPAWPIFVNYGGPRAAQPSLFVPNSGQVPDRFLYSSTKDFFTIYAKTKALPHLPW